MLPPFKRHLKVSQDLIYRMAFSVLLCVISRETIWPLREEMCTIRYGRPPGLPSDAFKKFVAFFWTDFISWPKKFAGEQS